MSGQRRWKRLLSAQWNVDPLGRSGSSYTGRRKVVLLCRLQLRLHGSRRGGLAVVCYPRQCGWCTFIITFSLHFSSKHLDRFSNIDSVQYAFSRKMQTTLCCSHSHSHANQTPNTIKCPLIHAAPHDISNVYTLVTQRQSPPSSRQRPQLPMLEPRPRR